jgi:hypothetical protein
MPHGPLPLRTHAAIEPLVAIVLIAGPWLFGFNDIESCTIVSVAIGAVMLVSGMITRWRMSLFKLLSLRTHFATDLIVGVILIVTPFIAEASDRGDATRFMVIIGALELLTALSTNWDQREEFEVRHHAGGGAAPAR